MKLIIVAIAAIAAIAGLEAFVISLGANKIALAGGIAVISLLR